MDLSSSQLPNVTCSIVFICLMSSVVLTWPFNGMKVFRYHFDHSLFDVLLPPPPPPDSPCTCGSGIPADQSMFTEGPGTKTESTQVRSIVCYSPIAPIRITSFPFRPSLVIDLSLSAISQSNGTIEHGENGR